MLSEVANGSAEDAEEDEVDMERPHYLSWRASAQWLIGGETWDK